MIPAASTTEMETGLAAVDPSYNSLGSKYWVYRVDEEMILKLADLPLEKVSSRVYLDCKRRMAMLMSISSGHGHLAEDINMFVQLVSSALNIRYVPLRSARLRDSEKNLTGIEADNTYYIGTEKTSGYEQACRASDSLYIDWMIDNPPDLVIDVGVTSIDDIIIERYRESGVTELWRVNITPGLEDRESTGLETRVVRTGNTISVVFFSLQDPGQHIITTSNVLPGIRSNDAETALTGFRNRTGTSLVEYIEILTATFNARYMTRSLKLLLGHIRITR